MHYAGKKTTLSLIKIKINLNQFNSTDWFLYDNGLCHERVKELNDSLYYKINSSVDRMLLHCTSSLMEKMNNVSCFPRKQLSINGGERKK